MGNLQESLSYCSLYLQLAEQIQDKQEMSSAHHNIGMVLAKGGHPEKAVESFRKSLSISTELDSKMSKMGMGLTYNAIGNVHKELKQITDARNYYEKALKTYSEINYSDGIIQSKRNISQISSQ